MKRCITCLSTAMQEASDQTYPCIYLLPKPAEGYKLLLSPNGFRPKTGLLCLSTCERLRESERDPIRVVRVVVVVRPIGVHIVEIVRVVGRTQPPVGCRR